MRDGEFLPIAFGSDRMLNRFFHSPAIETGALIQKQGVVAGTGDAGPVILPLYRREIAKEEQILFPGRAESGKTENTPLGVVTVDPLETVTILVLSVEGRGGPVKMQQVVEKFL